MKGYKIVDQTHVDKGRIYIQDSEMGGFMLCASPTLQTQRAIISKSTIDERVQKGILEEVDLITQRWVHPHLLKSIREELLSDK